MSGNEEQTVRVLTEAVARLRAAGVEAEALAEFVPPRRVLLIQRAATMKPLGEAWRLGTLLLGVLGAAPGSSSSSASSASEPTGPTLWAAGQATRAAARPYPGNQSISREERRDIAAAALKGGYAEGTPVNFDAVKIALDESSLLGLAPEAPIGLVDGELRVRWRAGASLEGAATLETYLAERIGLLIDGHDPA